MKNWRLTYEVLSSGAVEIAIKDGDGNDDKARTSSVREHLKANPAAPVVVRINSSSGSGGWARALHADLAQHKGKVIAEIDGVAGSGEYFAAIAAEHIRMEATARMTLKEDLNLYGFPESIYSASVYKERRGLAESEFERLVSSGASLSAEQAKAKGLVDEVFHRAPNPSQAEEREDEQTEESATEESSLAAGQPVDVASFEAQMSAAKTPQARGAVFDAFQLAVQQSQESADDRGTESGAELEQLYRSAKTPASRADILRRWRAAAKSGQLVE